MAEGSGAGKKSEVLITGALGAIGSYVLKRFISEGVRPLVYDIRKDLTLVKNVEDKFDFIEGDVTDEKMFGRAIEDNNITCVVHMSSALGKVCESEPKVGWHINVDGTLNVLENARKYGVKKVLYASSKASLGHLTGEYGNPTFKPVGEDHPFRPESFYGATKGASELIGRQYKREFGIEFAAFRFASTYGPGKMSRHGVASGISKIIEAGIFNRPLAIKSGGDQKNDYVYNGDLGRAIYLAYKASGKLSTAYNIGSGELHTLKDVAEIVRKRHPGVDIEIGPGLVDVTNAGELSYGLMDITRAGKEIGYRPAFNLADGIADYEKTVASVGLDHSV